MSTEDAWKAARHLNDGAEVANRAANSLSESTHRLTHMFEPGYGGLAEQLVELMQTKVTVEELTKQRDALLTACREVKPESTRLSLRAAHLLIQALETVEAQL